MKINIKSLVGYLFIVAVSVLFMLFLDGPGGTYLVIVTVAGLFISLGILLWTKRTLSFSVKLSEDVLNKGDVLRVELTLRKRGFVPTSLIKFSFSDCMLLISDTNESYTTIIFGHDEETMEKSFKACFFGSGRTGVNKIVLSDYFDLFRYEIIDRSLISNIRIYPDIPEVSGKDSFVRSLTDAVAFDDNEETTRSADSICGTPGYEHRKYNPGDNLKLINWKLSAKRGELLVRKLEGTGNGEQLFALAFDNFHFAESQFAAEAMLGLIMNFAKAELPVRVIVFLDNNWIEREVNNTGDLQQLRYDMTSYNIFPISSSLSPEERREARKMKYPDIPDGENGVIFAPVYNETLSATLEKLMAKGTECQAAVCGGEFTDDRVRRIFLDGGNVRFSE